MKKVFGLLIIVSLLFITGCSNNLTTDDDVIKELSKIYPTESYNIVGKNKGYVNDQGCNEKEDTIWILSEKSSGKQISVSNYSKNDSGKCINVIRVTNLSSQETFDY